MRAFIVIKPDGVERGLIGEIISRFERCGFKIAALKIVHLNKETAEKLYIVHKDKPFFESLIDYITSGPVAPAILRMDDINAEKGIELVRKIVGSTNPLDAEMGSIRGDYASDISNNIIHASDTEESLQYETPIFFSENELLD